ncbi:MAG TPA: PEP-CTERM sorting domain-containing protein [Candidatus Aquilonibacter sp.]|nr:PEP-CTERM sorting domain-containing protein [Candidatus Aquilonibacter sp.]
MLLISSGSAFASISTFSGQDDGASTTGPFPNSTAAQAAFETAALGFGSLNTITYENLAVGYYSPFTAAPGVTVTLNTPTNFGDGFSGISDTTLGNLYGFNTTPGGNQWLGFPGGSATFDFADPTNSFGTWITGLQTYYTSTITITFDDGTSETLDVPINVNGGAQYFGFTDTTAFDSVTITDDSDDAWGIDDTTYNAVAATPEPSSLFMLGTGILGLAGAVRRRIKA